MQTPHEYAGSLRIKLFPPILHGSWDGMGHGEPFPGGAVLGPMVLLALLLAQEIFETGAREKIREIIGPSLDASRLEVFERFARCGHERLFARDASTWFPYVLHGLLSDQERVAAASLRGLRELCARHGITNENGANPAS